MSEGKMGSSKAEVGKAEVVQTEEGYGAQVLTVTGNHSYLLNELELKKILMREDIKDLPLALVSVAGAFRGGKSFLLNFFIRYLKASAAAQSDGSWLGDNSAPLIGFSWRGGSVRNTTGILMWSEPFIVQTSATEKVAVILLDTQGTFDDTSTIRDCSTIFGLSTLLSSVQIYNLKENIKEDDLQNLQLFTDYGKLMKDKSGKSFQVLEFLVRDWMNESEYNYGQIGGEEFLNKKLKIKQSQAPELKKLREHIRESFEKVTCFLMPHPGLIVGKPFFRGEIAKIEPEFKEKLKELAYSLFSKDKLTIKKIGGQPVKSREFLSYFKTYVNIFNSDKLPSPLTIFQATVEVGLLNAYNEAREQFQNNMMLACGPETASIPKEDVTNLITEQIAAARATFKAHKLMGSNEDIDKKVQELTEELKKRKDEFLELNESKIAKAILSAKTAYDKTMNEVIKDRPLCLHARDLVELHESAIKVAKSKFDAKRKVTPGMIDNDRQKLVEELELKRNTLRKENEYNNAMNVNELSYIYFTEMVAECNQTPKLTPSELKSKHEEAQKNALKQFDSRRNRPNPYNDDFFRTNLITLISSKYETVKLINRSSNTGAFQRAILSFTTNTVSMRELGNHCLSPLSLKEMYEAAKCTALKIFKDDLSEATCVIGFNDNDTDQFLLHQIIDNTYFALVEINVNANKLAVEQCFNLYKEEFDKTANHWYYNLITWNELKKAHNDALYNARNVFYMKRRDTDSRPDEYKQDLQSRCEKHYNGPLDKLPYSFKEF